MDATKLEIKAQPGPQSAFLSTSADIAIYGGSAGGGKSFGLLLETLRHSHNPNFGAVIFRKTTPEIKGEGGLWDESEKLYPLIGGRGSRHNLKWAFPSGSKVTFSHMENDSDRFRWQGQQIPLIGFDELTHFSETVFWYMLSRNRSLCGVKPYIRATCNPDADSFVAKLISWWIDPETGYAIPERSGVIRWFARADGENLVWGDTKEEIVADYPEASPQSLTFIRSNIFDNKILMEKDPNYLSKLKNLQKVERERLLHGNWKIRPAAGMYFKREFFEIVDAAPKERAVCCRYWDRAGTKKKVGNDPAWTAGVKVSRDKRGIFYVEDVRRMRESPHTVEQAMINTAKQDGINTMVAYMQDPGSAGLGEAQATARALAGFIVKYAVATGDKETRAKPASCQAEAGNMKIVRGPWNDDFLTELENFPDSPKKDQVDGLSGAFFYVDAIHSDAEAVKTNLKPITDKPSRGRLLM